MRKAFTLIELIFVILISSVLAIGTFKAIGALYVRSAKAQAITDLSLNSQIVLDEISVYLYNRVPNSVIGYDVDHGICSPIHDLIGKSNSILEWLGTMDDELLSREYDGFIDMGDSNSTATPPFLSTPFMSKDFNDTGVNLVFSGAFDAGTEESYSACAGAFGWHGNDSNLSYDIKVTTANKIEIDETAEYQPDYIYEKYYLTKTAYAVARGKDLDINQFKSHCAYDISKLKDFNNTLFLFYNYKPFKEETFCGDPMIKGTETREGKVSILAEDVSAFEAEYVNETIKINLDMNRSIRGSKNDVHISKQKAIF